MSSFEWSKNIEDSIKDGLIITATKMRAVYAIKALTLRLPPVIEQTGGILPEVFVKDYMVYKKWIYE